jgi:UDP-N-acetylglucosamine 2-epimerase (non-hydrolysing)
MRTLVVIGTRPEAIKLAPLVHALSAAPGFQVRTCITSQHTDLLTPMLAFFGLRPDFDLQVMTPGQTLAQVTTRVLQGMDELLTRDPYDLVVVQGDTTTAFAAGLAAFYRHVPIAHVEAGLRSGDLARPFPEEGNRRLVDVLTAYLLAPTSGARDNLLAEGYPAGRIFVTGNTGIDALFLAADIVRKQARRLPVALPPGSRLALVTAHRRESFGEGLRRICTALTALLERHPELHLLYPVHPNPNVVEATNALLRGRPRVHLVPPLEYPDFVRALLDADVILTDSGGVQEEAPALGKRVLVMRETTERPEGIDSGAAELVGTDVDRIVSRASALLDGAGTNQRVVSPYGDGRASARIVEVLRTGALEEPFGTSSGGLPS